MLNRMVIPGWVLGMALLSTLAAFTLTGSFPGGARGVSDWQVEHLFPPGRIDPSIVLVTVVEADRAAWCGEGRWNLNSVEDLILALGEAGAAAIAPVLTVSMPVPSECGGLPGLVRLGETTRHVGTVVYPDTVPPLLAEAASAVGGLAVRLDHDGVFQRLTASSSLLSSGSVTLPPLGLVLASRVQEEKPLPASFIGQQPRFVGGRHHPPFPAYPFADVWKLVHMRDFQALTDMFHGKAVILFAHKPTAPTLATSRNVPGPDVALHAVLANAVLTNEWISAPPWWAVGLVTLGACLTAGLCLLRRVSLSRASLFALAGVGAWAIMALLVSMFQGWVWPVLASGIAVSLTGGGTIAFRIIRAQSDVQRRLSVGRERLRQLRTELAAKQRHGRDLERQLLAAQKQASQAVTAIEELQANRDALSRQLEESEREIGNTQRQIERLQQECDDLRPQIPVATHNRNSTSVTGDQASVIDECASYHIITRDLSVLRIFQDLKKAAATHNPILLLGETGTGKEVFAKAAHALSSRREGPFVSVNMAAIRPELFEGELFGHIRGAFTGAVGRKGYIEAAQGGTLFLDEVGELPSDLQAKLLRFLEDGTFYRVGENRLTRVDARIIAATNCHLQQEVESGVYRGDLYYRLCSIVFTLPPLRQRGREDRLLLAHMFLRECAGEQQREALALSQGALDAIEAYEWPGNIRELRHTIARAVALAEGSVVTAEDLQLTIPATPSRQVTGDAGGSEERGRREDSMVLECLRRCHFDMQATANALHWDRGTVTQRLKGLGFQALVAHQENFEAAARSLAGNEALTRVVEGRLREYAKNLLPSSKQYASVEEALADCRKRFRNLPERHFPAVERLVHWRFSAPG